MRKIHPLLKNIREEIRAAGGNACMAYAVMCENPSLFTDRDIQSIKNKADSVKRNKRWSARQPKRPGTLWSKPDEHYVLEWYGKMKSGNLARILNRSRCAVREFFLRTATPEQKQWVIKNGRYAGRVNNFKK